MEMNEVTLNERFISAVVEIYVKQQKLLDNVKRLLHYGDDPNATLIKEMASLHCAAESGNKRILKQLLKSKADVNLKRKDGSTPLHRAVKDKKNISRVKLLLECGAEVNSKNDKNITPLHMAIFFGNIDIVKLLLSYGADLNLKSECGDLNCGNGSTPLHVAAKNPRSSSCTNFLLICGAEIESRDEDGFTPFHIAVKHNSVRNAKLLLDNNADVNTKENAGWTPLHTAAESEKKISLIESLIVYGAEIEATDEKGRTALHIAVEFNRVKNVKLLLESKAAVSSKNQDGLIPLYIALKNNNTYILKLLLEHGADPDARCAKGMTPLHNVFSFGLCDLYTLMLLLRYKADVNSMNNDGETPLHLAVRKATEIYIYRARVLLKYNADINIKNKEGKTPFEYIPSASLNYDARVSYETIFHRNVLIRQAGNMYVDVANLRLFALIAEFRDLSDDGKSITDQANEEIEHMKNVAVVNGGVSLYDILTFNLNQMARYTRNEEIMQLETHNLEKEFPMYGCILRSQFIRGTERKRLFDQFRLYGNNWLPLPMECHENIISYISNSDFRNLFEVFKT